MPGSDRSLLSCSKVADLCILEKMHWVSEPTLPNMRVDFSIKF